MHHIQLVASALLSWTQFVCWTTSPVELCESGWFGSNCQFKCRCKDNLCDIKGRCLDGGKCLEGWFGPACQYVDLAYGRATLEEITDGDDDTCINTAVSTVSIQLNGYYIMTWVRIIVCKSGRMQNLMFVVEHNGTYVNCSTLSIYAPDKKTRDLDCDFKEPVISITIAGVACICSLYVSGGRNVALKQLTRQSSVYEGYSMSFTSDKAVDGNTSQNIFDKSCIHTTTNPWPHWTVTLSQPARINRYVIYNWAGNSELMERLEGFQIASYDHLEVLAFIYTDVNPTPQLVYTVVHPDLVIERTTIYAASMAVSLAFCEFEIYGDSNCTHGYYGLECEKKCNCFFQGKCFVSTGGCLEGCATGYMGDDCNTPCPPGQFGNACKLTCSKFCVDNNLQNTTCHHVTGDCLLGCQDGYEPPTCETVCRPEMFGPGCNKSCSPACRMPSEYKNTSCDNINGTCLFGCDTGYYGPSCSTPCQPNHYGEDCRFFCSRGCAPSNVSNESPCHHVTGECYNGCADGRNGTLCELILRQINQGQSQTFSIKDILIACIVAVVCGLLTCVTVLYCIQKNARLHSIDESRSSDLTQTGS